jgi:hypothetical protein
VLTRGFGATSIAVLNSIGVGAQRQGNLNISNNPKTAVCMRLRTVLGAFVLLLVMSGAAVCEPKRVLILNPFGREFVPWNEYGRSFREELLRRFPEGVDLYETALATARSSDAEEGPFADYLQTLFAKRQLDLVVAISNPAIRFVQKYRQQIFPSVPAVFMGVEQRRVPRDSMTKNDALVVIANDFVAIVDNILTVLPNTTNIVIIFGNSPNEQYWSERVRNELKPLESRVTFTSFNDLSLEQMVQRAAVLPSNSVIFFWLMTVDAAGIPHEEGKALARLRAATNAPIFSYTDAFLGDGIVGGPLISIS